MDVFDPTVHGTTGPLANVWSERLAHRMRLGGVAIDPRRPLGQCGDGQRIRSVRSGEAHRPCFTHGPGRHDLCGGSAVG